MPNPEEIIDPEERESRANLDQEKAKYLPEVEDVSTQLADQVDKAIQKNEFPLILGGVESLIEVPSLMIPDEVSHESATAEIPETLVRISVGIEHVDDLCEDLCSALP